MPPQVNRAAIYSWIGGARNRAHVARCASEPSTVVSAELGLIAEAPLVGDLGNAFSAVRIAQHGVAHQKAPVADVGADGDAFSLKDLVQVADGDTATICHHLWC